jgi:hypothetical protein
MVMAPRLRRTGVEELGSPLAAELSIWHTATRDLSITVR